MIGWSLTSPIGQNSEFRGCSQLGGSGPPVSWTLYCAGGSNQPAAMSDQVSNLKAAIFANLNELDGLMPQYEVKANPSLKKSECWTKFGHVHAINGELVQTQGTSFVACFVCHAVYTFKSKNGTSTIMGHKCPHEKAAEAAAAAESDDKKDAKRKAKNPDLDALKRDITKALLEDDVMKGYTLLSNPAATKSDCWKRFGHVYLHGTLLEAFDSGFVACYGCKVVYQYKVRNGTSTMTTHACSAAKEEIEMEARKGLKRAHSSSSSSDPLLSKRHAKDDVPPKKVLDLRKHAITASLLSDNSAYELRPNTSESKAECWTRFGFVYRHNALLLDHGTYFVACYDCKAVYQFKSKNGTSSLLSHTCAMRKANERTRQTLQQALLQAVTDDVLPPDVLAGAGFRAVWHMLLEAAKTQSHALDKWLPEPATLHAQLQSQFASARLALLDTLAPHVADGLHLAVSWSAWAPPPPASLAVVAVYVHFVDADFVVHDRVLDVHTTSSLDTPLALVHNSIQELGVAPTAVTLCSATLAPPEWSAFSSCHVFAASELDELHAYVVPNDDVLQMIQSLVVRGGDGGAAWPLVTTDVTWQALLRGLQYVHADPSARWPLPTNPPETLLPRLEATMAFCAPFVSAAQAFEAPHAPTLHTVCYWRHALAQHCEAQADDEEEIALLRAAALARLQQWQLSPQHVMAALLDPGQRKRVASKFGVRVDEIAVAKEELRRLLLEAVPHVKEAKAATTKASKRANGGTILSMYGADSDDDDDGGAVDADAEWNKYFEGAHVDETETNVLQWWKWQAKRWPLLARVARSVLGLPAAAKVPDVVKKHRGLLSAANAREILFLQSNRDLRAPTTTAAAHAAESMFI
ncbi:Aste57867_19059 [Aphanomyces stellatus]|uniref:Aste57867_19059 protein n=1 Tax=Aphanomyces stellatus TaxID=120398 RepID=A0A485LDM4_9STRA|nr:hypothetical protein As57867_018995 [Aphanomyces stellatus]VFT95784.1 Aste57867_19059 [Aphanomyces stellatus]